MMALSGNKNMAAAMCLWLAVVSFISHRTSAELRRFEQPTRGDGTLRFLVVGDWGRKGEFNQSQVAFQMGRIGEELDIDFVVSTGDNWCICEKPWVGRGKD
ncbi:UNVERIFIED_CONTAM: Purple acid phosphatase 3 [Sesamum angustifolium]|uniref:Purple acid phosphatase 3 n=1 Tax=Sesamum angustifolium TaxID=2727405 RepID=A0AAW2RJ57_9LAMI